MRFLSSMLILSIVALANTTCKKTEFSGDDAKAPAASPPVRQADASPTVSPSPSPCVGDGVTIAKLISTAIKVKTAGQYVDYELQLTDCAGNPKSITNQPLKFDLNAVTDSLTTPIPYQLWVNDASSNKINDNLKSVPGTDLFGNSGSSYAHWETQSINFVPELAIIHLRLDVSNRLFLPMGSKAKTLTSPVSIPTFLQLGNATPVQQNITVNP